MASDPQLSRISTALARAQHALHVSDDSVHDLQTKIADTKDEISAISVQIASLRKTMAQKFDLQEHLEDLLPLAIQERERSLNRVRRLEQALDDLERHLTAEDWYEEEEMEEFATGHAADKYAKFLKEVGRASPQADEIQAPDVSQRVQQLVLDPSFQAEGLKTIEQDIRLPSEIDTLPASSSLEPQEIHHASISIGSQDQPFQNNLPKTDEAEASQNVPSDYIPRPITQSIPQSPPHDLIDFEEVAPQIPTTIPQYPAALPDIPPSPSSPESTQFHLDTNAPEFVKEALAE